MAIDRGRAIRKCGRCAQQTLFARRSKGAQDETAFERTGVRAMPYARLFITLLFFQLETLGYLLVNRLSARRRSIPLFAPADEVLPFSPRSLWLYLSFVPYCLFVILDIEGIRQMFRIIVCVFINSLISYRSFLKFPSAYPRQPVVCDGPQLEAAWGALRSLDRPTNTFPSIHVGHALLLAFILSRRMSRERGDAYLLWATLISLSTLNTKQHFIVDVTGGILVADAVATHVYEPWEEGRLSWRAASRELRALCARLDGIALHPSAYQLDPELRHSRLNRLLVDLAGHEDLLEVYARSEGRHLLFDRTPVLLGLLERFRPLISLLTGVTPGWLQFTRQFEEGAPLVSDESVKTYLGGLAAELRQAACLLIGSGAVPRASSPATG